MEVVEDVVIVGAGIAGLATALGLHRLGVRSLVLESWDCLRVSGYALTTWTNAWKALDALGVGDTLRQEHVLLDGHLVSSTVSGLQTAELPMNVKGKHGQHESRAVKRKSLLETLAKELPDGTVRYSSKVVSIEESGYFKLVHLADGKVLKTKVLIGCDGVNSLVAKWLGFKTPAWAGRYAVRGYFDFKHGHSFKPKFTWYFGNGIRSGAIPCDDKVVYWFITWSASAQDPELEEQPGRLKQYLLSKLGKVPDQVRGLMEDSELDCFTPLHLRLRLPWELLWKDISRGNVCIAGDALHPLTPDIGQGGCSALEDAVVLARCLAGALAKTKPGTEKEEKEEYERIEKGLKQFAKERKWRSIKLIVTSYVVGFIQESKGGLMSFLRDKVLAEYLAKLLMQAADFDCGKLSS